MKVGIFAPTIDNTVGGAFTFTDSILQALPQGKSGIGDHEFYVFHYGKETLTEQTPGATVHYVALRRPKPAPRAPTADFSWRRPWAGRQRVPATTTTDLSHGSNPLEDAARTLNLDIMWYLSPIRYEPVTIPFVMTVLDLQHRLQPYFPEVSVTGFSWSDREAFYGSVLPRASYVIVGTEIGKREIAYFYRIPEERIRVIPFPTPPYALADPPTTQDVFEAYHLPKPYLFYPAQYWPHKNHIALLLALRLLRQRHASDLGAVFVGSDQGNLAYVKEQTHLLGLDDCVRFLGFVPQADLVALYRNAFALVFPSLFGPDNIPPLEAFALGCPVIAANVPGSAEQLGDAALRVDARQEAQISDAVLALFQDADRRAQLIERGRLRAQAHTVHHYVREACGLFDEFESLRRCWSRTHHYAHRQPARKASG